MPQASNNNVCIKLEHQKIDYREGIEFVRTAKCGAINTFLGTVRGSDTKNGSTSMVPINALFFEAYESMALKKINAIAELVVCYGPKDPQGEYLSRVYINHRLGRVQVGEDSLHISVSSPSRDYSHESTLSILNKVKTDVPIWKSIEFADGSHEWPNMIRSEAFWISPESKKP